MNGASSMHLSIFGMHPVIVHGSEELKRENLPRIVHGDLHVCFGVTEPGAGLDTTRITTFARRDGVDYIVNGRKVWISKAMESEKVLLLTRTTKFEDVAKKTDGLTLFLTDLDRDHVDIRPIAKMGRNAVSSNELFIDDLRVPEAHRVGEEGQGFRYILDGLNPERMLVAAEALGIGRAALRRAVRYGNERVGVRPADRHEPGPPVPAGRLAGPARRRRAGAAQGHLALRQRQAVRAGRRTPPSTCAPTPGSTRPTARCRPTAAWATPRSTTSRGTSARPG